MRTPWQLLHSLTLGLDWQSLDGLAIDAYIVWADATRFIGLQPALQRAGGSLDPKVPLVLELANQQPSIAQLRRSKVLRSLAEALPRPMPPIMITPRFWTVRVPISALPLFFHPEVQKYILRAELGLPTRTPTTYANVATALNGGLASGLGAGRGQTFAAVIDDGCAFANAAFVVRKAGKKPQSRLHRLWFQEDLGFSYGRVGFDKPALEKLLQAGASGDRINEARCYDAMDKALRAVPGGQAIAADWRRQMRSTATHGTHVLDTMGGNPNPLAHPRYGYGSAPDHAANSELIFVQLPRAAVADTSGASMNSYVLEALTYIRGVIGKKDKVVVNLSYGALAGPHDGSTLLEEAIDDVLANDQRIKYLVLPAGNGYDSRTHAQLHAVNDGQWRTISLQILPDDPTDTFVELWYDPGMPTGTGGGTAVLDVEVVTSDGTLSGDVMLGTCKEWPPAAGNGPPRAAVIHLRRPIAGGGSKNQVLIAIAPTKSVDSQRSPAPHGVWTIKVRNRGGLSVPVDAWIERDDSPFGSGRSRSQAAFLSRGVDPAPGAPHGATDPVVRQRCLNSFAHGARTTIIGGCSLRPPRLASYSASGPGRKGADSGPTVVAPCENTAGSGLLAAGTRSAQPAYLNGTSVAAAAASRQYVNSVASGRPLPPPDKSTLLPQPSKHPNQVNYPDPALRRGAGLLKPL